MIRQVSKRYAAALALAATVAATVHAGAQDGNAPLTPQQGPEFIQLWDELTPKLEQALRLEDRHDALPDSAWFGPDKTSNRDSINALLDEAVAVLATPGGRDYRGDIRELERAIDADQRQIATLRQRRVGAPDSALWQKTAADIDAEIAALTARNDERRAAIAALKNDFATELRAMGVAISDEQLTFLLSTVIGDDVIALGVAFDSVKAVTEQLEILMVDSGEDLDAAKRYYGLYTLLLTALERLHDRLLGEVRHYLSRLDNITERTADLMQQSRSLQREGRHQRTLAANVAAQQLTLKTAEVYRRYLVEQARDVSASRERLAHDIAVARNTYDTVRVSGDLVQMVHAGQDLFEQVFSREAPPMFTFRNLEMQREFEKLTLKLRERDAEGD